MKFVDELDKFAGFAGSIFGGEVIGLLIEVGQREGDIVFPTHASAWRDNKYDEFVDLEAMKEESEKLIKNVLSGNLRIQYFKDMKVKIEGWIQLLAKYKEKILPTITELPDKDFLDEFDRFIKMYSHYYGLAPFSFTYEPYISERVSEETNVTPDADEYIFAYIDEINKEYKSFMILYEEEVRKLADGKTTKEELLNKFYYVKSNYTDSVPLSEDQVNADLKELKKENHKKNPTEGLDAFLSKIDKRQRAMLDILAHTLPIRDLRKEFNQIGQYIQFRFFDEALKRKKVEEKRDLYLRMRIHEMKELLENPQKLGEKLQKRKEITMYIKNGKYHFYEFYAIKARDVEHTNTIKGVVASKGRVDGVARVIMGPSEFKNFKKGEILVTEATRPDFVPIMKIARAIIAEEGGITNHTAIVSRELGIPCLVGVSHVTSRITSGELIEVDAVNGVVKKL